jgi:hypothetical protein
MHVLVTTPLLLLRVLHEFTTARLQMVPESERERWSTVIPQDVQEMQQEVLPLERDS